MAVDLFDTRTMLAMLAQLKPAKSWLKDTFFSNAKPFETEYVDIDVFKGTRRMAPFVSPALGSKTVERQGYTTYTYKPALVCPDMITTAQDLLHRAMGEGIYGGMSPDEKAQAQIIRDWADMDDMITRTEEQLCAQALMTGAVTMTGDGVSETISFGLDGTHNLDPSSTLHWNETTADVLGDLRAWKRLCVKDSGISPTHLVMGQEAADAFMSNAKVLAALDNRRVVVGQLEPKDLPDGVTYYGRIEGLDLYGYDEWYLDANGVEQPMIAVHDVLLASTRARMDMLYGAIADPVRGTFALPRIPRSWIQEKPSARFLSLGCRPLPVPVQIDSILVATVLD